MDHSSSKNPTPKQKQPPRQSNPDFNPLLPISKANPLIDLDKAIQFRLKGLSYDEIAAIFHVSKSAVCQRLNGYISEHIDIPGFLKHEAEILAGKRAEILNSLTVPQLKTATPYQRVGMYGILFDKERLLRGQSTQNIAYADMSRDLNEMDREIHKLEAELGDKFTAENGELSTE